MYKTEELFDLQHSIASDYLKGFEQPWEALPGIKELIPELGKTLDAGEYEEIKDRVWVHRTAKIDGNVTIIGPAIIGKNSAVKHCAYIRENVIIGDDCTIGNSCEVKNAIIFDNTQVPHFNYVGDSILGYHAHMGAGSIVSNLKSDGSNVTVRQGDERFETHLRKFGAMIGDFVEIGCNSVLNPGTIVGRHTNIYPLSRVRGLVPENSIYKDAEVIVEKQG